MAVSKTLGEINREHFDSVAESIWKESWVRDLVSFTINLIRDNVEWIGLPKDGAVNGTDIRMLDYACGNGTVSLALSPYVTYIRGIDISPKMIEQFNETSKNSGFTAEQMRGVQGDLLDAAYDKSLDWPEFKSFDIAVMCLALHHVEDTDLMLRKLAERVKEGGTVLIVDWGFGPRIGGEEPEHGGSHDHSRGHEHGNGKHQGHGHGHSHGHGHGHEHEYGPEGVEKVTQTVAHKHGFDKKDMMEMFARAGLKDASFVAAPRTYQMPEKMGGERLLFLARGTK